MRQWKRDGWVGLALVATGRGSDSEMNPVPNEPVQFAARLESFAGCEALEWHIEDSATKQMRASLESLKNQDSSYADGTAQAGAPAEGAAGRDASGPANHTETNSQVQGVHEADFVQDDGTRIFMLSGLRLYVHRSWPAEQLVRTTLLEVSSRRRYMRSGRAASR